MVVYATYGHVFSLSYVGLCGLVFLYWKYGYLSSASLGYTIRFLWVISIAYLTSKI